VLERLQALSPQAFPQRSPKGANFYPEDMNETGIRGPGCIRTEEEQELATGFFTVIRRASQARTRSAAKAKKRTGRLLGEEYPR